MYVVCPFRIKQAAARRAPPLARASPCFPVPAEAPPSLARFSPGFPQYLLGRIPLFRALSHTSSWACPARSARV